MNSINRGISLIVNTYENPWALAQVFLALRGQAVRPREVVVADDGSGEPTRLLVEQASLWGESAGCPVQHCWQKNEGFRRAKILNQAIARCSGDYIVFLDGDSVPQTRFILDHTALAEQGFFVQGRRAFVIESAVQEFRPNFSTVVRYALSRRLTGAAKGFRLPFPIVRKDQGLAGILGCNLGIWRRDLIEVNGYDEEFVGWGREDSELASRLYNLGRRRKLVHNWAVIYHLNHPVVSRSNLDHNQRRLEQTLALRRQRCERGVSQYLG